MEAATSSHPFFLYGPLMMKRCMCHLVWVIIMGSSCMCRWASSHQQCLGCTQMGLWNQKCVLYVGPISHLDLWLDGVGWDCTVPLLMTLRKGLINTGYWVPLLMHKTICVGGTHQYWDIFKFEFCSRYSWKTKNKWTFK